MTIVHPFCWFTTVVMSYINAVIIKYVILLFLHYCRGLFITTRGLGMLLFFNNDLMHERRNIITDYISMKRYHVFASTPNWPLILLCFLVCKYAQPSLIEIEKIEKEKNPILLRTIKFFAIQTYAACYIV